MHLARAAVLRLVVDLQVLKVSIQKEPVEAAVVAHKMLVSVLVVLAENARLFIQVQ